MKTPMQDRAGHVATVSASRARTATSTCRGAWYSTTYAGFAVTVLDHKLGPQRLKELSQ
ncbi:MAG: hypothetical protein WHS89_06945 [Acidimicrobiales bacterium]|jgi:hypothetical protein